MLTLSILSTALVETDRFDNKLGPNTVNTQNLKMIGMVDCEMTINKRTKIPPADKVNLLLFWTIV